VQAQVQVQVEPTLAQAERAVAQAQVQVERTPAEAERAVAQARVEPTLAQAERVVALVAGALASIWDRPSASPSPLGRWRTTPSRRLT
jgi:hypothetical protein